MRTLLVMSRRVFKITNRVSNDELCNTSNTLPLPIMTHLTQVYDESLIDRTDDLPQGYVRFEPSASFELIKGKLDGFFSTKVIVYGFDGTSQHECSLYFGNGRGVKGLTQVKKK